MNMKPWHGSHLSRYMFTWTCPFSKSLSSRCYYHMWSSIPIFISQSLIPNECSSLLYSRSHPRNRRLNIHYSFLNPYWQLCCISGTLSACLQQNGRWTNFLSVSLFLGLWDWLKFTDINNILNIFHCIHTSTSSSQHASSGTRLNSQFTNFHIA